MKTPKEILKEQIEIYNSQVSDVYKFQLNTTESEMFEKCMTLYSDQKLDEAARIATASADNNFGIILVNKQSILQLKDL